MKTLIVFSHTYFKDSKVNKALLEAATTLPHVKIRNLDQIYGTDISKINIETEVEELKKADKIIFMFPMFWLNMPAMLKAYIDTIIGKISVWSTTDLPLKGKELYVAVSTGTPKKNYQKDGANGHTIEEFLYSLETTAKYIGVEYKGHFHTDNAMAATKEEIEISATKFKNFLS